jgi:putative membrane protein
MLRRGLAGDPAPVKQRGTCAPPERLGIPPNSPKAFAMFRPFLIATAILTAAPAFAAPPAQFLHKAIEGDNSETTLGRLIASRGASAQVRSFGRTLVTDHSRARVEASAVARRMRVQPPTSVAPEARSEYRKLSRMQGPAFDREVKRYMVDDHRKDIADFTSQAQHGDRATSALARAQLPTLRKHLRIAQSLHV